MIKKLPGQTTAHYLSERELVQTNLLLIEHRITPHFTHSKKQALEGY